MKKGKMTHFIAFTSLVIFTVLGISCTSTIVYNDDIPKEQCATIIIPYEVGPGEYYTITEFSGQSVRWGTSQFRRYKILVPSGLHSIRFIYHGSNSDYIIEQNFNFLADHEYRLSMGGPGYAFSSGEIYGGIYDEKAGRLVRGNIRRR